jgi:hypothetical protein
VASTHQPLCTAIANKRLVSFTLDGFRGLAEPHDYGITNGVARLFFSQIGGGSRSGRPIGWRWVSLSKDLRAADPRREVCGAASGSIRPAHRLGRAHRNRLAPSRGSVARRAELGETEQAVALKSLSRCHSLPKAHSHSGAYEQGGAAHSSPQRRASNGGCGS